MNIINGCTMSSIASAGQTSTAGASATQGFVKIYCAPGDTSNPGTGTLLTSYSANGAVFGLQSGGTARFPALFNAKGTTNVVIFHERFAQPQPLAGTLWNRCWTD